MRIISGVARGRRLVVPPEGTRPTSDRAKEGLFSSLNVRFGFDGARVLDLFSGSGALGLEAASRGADHVVLVDSDASAIEAIKKNAAVIPEADVEIIHFKASTYLATAPKNYFDMVLIDPPYALIDSSVTEMLEVLRSHLRDGAAVVVERSVASPETDWPAGYTPTGQKLKKRTYGAARMDMAVFSSSEAANSDQDTATNTGQDTAAHEQGQNKPNQNNDSGPQPSESLQEK